MKRIMKVEKKNFHFLYLHFIFRLFYIVIREDSMGIKRNTRHKKVIYRQVRP